MADEHSGNTFTAVLIDDRPDRRRLMRQIVLAAGPDPTEVIEVDDGAAALVLIEARSAGMVLLEIQLPVQSGLDAIAMLRRHFSELPIIVCSFHVELSTKQLALDAGADVYLDKPVRTEDLRKAIHDARGREGHLVALPSRATPPSTLPISGPTADRGALSYGGGPAIGDIEVTSPV